LMGILMAALGGGEYVALRASRTLGAAAVPQRIEAHEFVVLDDQNRPVALLGKIFPTRPMLIISEGLETLPGFVGIASAFGLSPTSGDANRQVTLSRVCIFLLC